MGINELSPGNQTCEPIRLSAVIPLVPAHQKFITELLENLESSHCGFEEVIFVASGFNPRRAAEVGKVTSMKSRLPLTTIFTPLQPAGANRNVGFARANGDLVAFLDADDLYNPHRNCFISKVFSSTDAEVFCHSFILNHGQKILKKKLVWDEPNFELECLSNSDFISATLESAHRKREEELLGNVPTGLQFNNLEDYFPIAHGHPVVRKSAVAGLAFHENPSRNEDGVYLRDLLELNRRFCVSPAQLSLYRKELSSGAPLLTRVVRFLGLQGTLANINLRFRSKSEL